MTPISTSHLLSQRSDVFEAVQRGEANLGVVPFENSTNGPVVFTLDHLADRDSSFKDVSVCGEIYLDVHHYLVGYKPPSHVSNPTPDERGSGSGSGSGSGTGSGPGSNSGSGVCTPTPADPEPSKPRAKPLVSLKHIRRIYSHPQAFGQCHAFLTTYIRSAEVQDVSSTSRAAELVKENGTGSWAAISSEIAAGLHGLDILAKCIEDREDNTTRFFIIGNKPRDLDLSKGRAPSERAAKPKSMVSFNVAHGSPGALADVLGSFRSSGLNLTSINSRPSLIQPFQYIFFVEFEGHKLRDSEGKVKSALEQVAKVAQNWRWLGSWDSQRS